MNKFLGVIINIGLVILPDKRIITILSTKLRSTSHNVSRSARYSNNIRRIEQPEMIIYYKQNMVDVNVANQYTISYCFLCRTSKCWRKYFFWRLEISLVNALYTKIIQIFYTKTKLKTKERNL